MARILIGSSNIYRFYNVEKIPICKQYKMVNCTAMEVFKVKMEELEKVNKEVVISVVENFICDAVKGVTDDAVTNGLCKKSIKDFLKIVHETANRLPESRFALAHPILRPGNVWYSERFEDITKFYSQGLKTMKSSNIMGLEPMSRMSQRFEYDGVHLTPDYGTIHIQTTLEKAEAFFNAELIDLEETMEVGEDVESVKVGSGKGKSLLQAHGRLDLGDRMTRVETGLQKLGSDIEARRFGDSLVSARMREELDAIGNINKEDRLIITGMVNKVPMPQGFQDKKKWVLDMVGDVVNRIEEGAAGKIIWANQGRRNEREIPMAEVKMESKEVARRIRLKFAEKKRAGEDFGKLFIANSVSLGTRVRIDIMKSMAKKYSSEKQDFHVAAFSSRPVLKVKEKDSDKAPMTFTFIDSVVRYGREMVVEELEDAYRRAGRAFHGQLQQNFVVLRDRESCPVMANQGASTSMESPRKRQRQEGAGWQNQRGAKGGRGARGKKW